VTVDAAPTDVRVVAPDVARDVARRLADDALRADAVERSRRTTAFPTVGWRPYSLAAGMPGLALLSATLDRLEPDRGWDRIGHTQLQAAVEASSGANAGASMFGGLAGLGLAADALAAGRDRYGRLLAGIDAEVAPRAEAIAGRLAGANGCGVGEFDVISGLSGIGGYLLRRREHPGPARALDTVLTVLADLLADTGRPRRWHTPAQLSGESMLTAFPDGSHNCGLAHGVPGPLALLSIAAVDGVEVEGTRSAIDVAARWLADHAVEAGTGPDWPNAVPRIAEPESTADRAAGPVTRSRPTWCYGSAGVARALWLAGQALDADRYRDLAVRALRAALATPPEERGITSPTFCHGTAGLLQITLRFAADTGLPDLAAAADELTAELLAVHEPQTLLGYRDVEYRDAAAGGDVAVDKPGLLDGAAGIALVLLAAGGVPSAWDRAFLLS
jgi:hypothetical protein